MTGVRPFAFQFAINTPLLSRRTRAFPKAIAFSHHQNDGPYHMTQRCLLICIGRFVG